MLSPTDCLLWDGITFRPRPCELVILPDGARLIPGDHPAANVTLAALRRCVQAMRINPQIGVYLGAGLEMHGYRVGEDEELYRIMLEYQPDFAEAYAPAFRARNCSGMCFGDGGFRQKIFVSTIQESMLTTLFHELFHSIYHNIPTKPRAAIEAFGSAIRQCNLKASFDHPDARPIRWLSLPEEAEAVAFERFATGQAMPFGLELPSPVEAAFSATLRGDHANHRTARG